MVRSADRRDLEHAQAELDALRTKAAAAVALCREVRETGMAFDSQQTLARRVLEVLDP